jgi:hypothetical protein
MGFLPLPQSFGLTPAAPSSRPDRTLYTPTCRAAVKDVHFARP